jgi:murein L,D-transpeptidase YafK
MGRTAWLATSLSLVLLLPGSACAGEEPLPADAQATKVRITKHERTLEVLQGERVLRRYRVALGRQPVGPKECEGDGRTPEGLYVVASRKPDSRFHRALKVSYPTEAQVQAARERGCDPGGDIMIHGLRNGLGFLGPLHRLMDWTQGCIAVTDAEIEEVWDLVPDGTPVEIQP